MARGYSRCMCVVSTVFIVLMTFSTLRADTLLWQLGLADDATAEFAPNKAPQEDIAVPPDWRIRRDWKMFPRRLGGQDNHAVNIQYALPTVPANGVMFSFKLLQAPKSGPQMAVFSNDTMAGLIQLWGTAETNSPYKWMKTYRLYIPRELLSAGKNTLRLEAARPIWSDSSSDRMIWWEWDYLKLESLSQPAREPIHGTVCYLGTSPNLGGNDKFVIDDRSIRFSQYIFPWMGVAYSGNTIRAHFWYDVTQLQPRQLELLKALTEMNLTVMADYISSHYSNNVDGTMPGYVGTAIDKFFNKYGNYIQYYELGNEPCMFGGGFQQYINVANYIEAHKPPHVKLAAPGWAYGGGKGEPVNWDANVVFRRVIEAQCQATNGHAYGYSYGDNTGGSFTSNLLTYKGVEDGWPKECTASETGTNDWHSEENGPRFASKQPHAQAFDRILRAHVAVVDRTMHHAAIFDDFGLFSIPKSWDDLEQLTAYPGVKGEDTRLKTFRRLALAYATHGAPLSYVITNRQELSRVKVYFRAVDTAAIPGQPGSQSTSNKILLNFVSFEPTEQTLKVRITLPLAGQYTGDRFGSGDTYAAAHSTVTLQAGPELELSEKLAPGDSVQYILTPPAAVRPYAPMNLVVLPADGQAQLAWSTSAGATGYDIKRSSNGSPYQTIANNVQGTQYTDATVTNGQSYSYMLCANNSSGGSIDSEQAAVLAGSPLPPTGLAVRNGNAEVTLSWNASARAEHYQILRAAGRRGAYQPIGEAAEPSYTDKSAINGTTYRYMIKGVNEYGTGPQSVAIEGEPQLPPPPPSGLIAVAGDQRVVLRWKAVPDTISYTLQRATTPGGPYTPIDETIYANYYNDDQVTNGTHYYYIVSARRGGPQGLNSTELTATPKGEPLPQPWNHQDIGEVGQRGSASYIASSGMFTICGSGQDVWGNADGMHYAFQDLDGDGSLVAHVVSYDHTDRHAKIGMAIRETLEPGSIMSLFADGPGDGAGLTTRATVNGNCTHSGGPFSPWLRLTRKGDTVTAERSNDGTKWETLATSKVKMAQHVHIGLAVCSHHNGMVNKVLFDNVRLTRGTAPSNEH